MTWGLTALALTLVWLWPFAGRPSVDAQPLQAGALLAAVALALSGAATPARHAGRTGGLILGVVTLACTLVWQLSQPWLWLLAAVVVVLCGLRVGLAARQERFAAVRWVALAWVVAGLLSSLMAALQYAGAASWWGPWVTESVTGRAYANLRQPNLFATQTMVALAALLYLAGRGGSSVRGAIWAAVAVALAMGNALSASRTGALQLVLLCGLVWWWRASVQAGQWRVLLTAVVAYGLVNLALVVFPGQGSGAELAGMTRLASQPIDNNRMGLWRDVLRLIAEHPWRGWGLGELDYAHYATLFEGARHPEYINNAHNLPLHLAVESGLPVALLVCGGVGWWVWRLRPWQERDPARLLAWMVLLLIGVHSLLEYPLWYAPFQLALGLCLGLLWPAVAEEGRVGHAVVYWPWRLLALVVMAFAALVAGDYHRARQIYLPPEARAATYRETALEQARASWFFQDQARFAELTLTPLTRKNARWSYETATALLHYSPEPKVIERVIESAVMLGMDEVAMWHMVRYRAAYPAAYRRWSRHEH